MRVALAVLALAAAACSNPGRVVVHELRVDAASPELLRRVAVAAFASAQPEGAVVSGPQVARFLSDGYGGYQAAIDRSNPSY